MHVNARALIECRENGKTQLLIQVRDDPMKVVELQFPGGRAAEFESLMSALRREETGLELIQK